jgi:predicted site-specific integrase-resolvase
MKEKFVMSLGKTWFSPLEASQKFGISKTLVLHWVDEGLVRAERKKGKVVQVNSDDIQLQVDDLSHRQHG